MEVEFDGLLEQVEGHQFWLTYLSDAARPRSRVGIHLAIFTEPFLSMVLSGEKTIESRFSRNRCAPYGEINDGDIILLKGVARPICGIALARRTWCYDLFTEPIIAFVTALVLAFAPTTSFGSRTPTRSMRP